MINSPSASSTLRFRNGRRLANSSSSDNPGTLYFTGVQFNNTDNGKEQPWSQPSVEGCCAKYTFPDGATTTVASSVVSSASGASTGTSTVNGTASASTTSSSDNYVTWITVGCALPIRNLTSCEAPLTSLARRRLAALALVALAALLVG